MKKLFTFLAVVLFAGLWTGCRSAQSISSGKADEAYIQFVSATEYDSILVVIDHTVTITAGVNDINQRLTKNTKTYAVLPGKHTLEISDSKGKKIIVKDIFVSSQEIRIVELP